LTSQLPVARWHEQIGDPTVADGILERLVHNAPNRNARGLDAKESRQDRRIANKLRVEGLYWQMMIEAVIRQPQPHEHDAVRAVVQIVVDEIYGGLWAPPPLPVDEENWGLSWVAIVDAKIVGMVLTHEEWISDLWVVRQHRGRGVGHRLLAQGEAEIVRRGHRTLRLRVLQSNTAAINFYNRQGRRVAREFPHEKFPVTVLEMVKSVRQRKA